MSSLLELLKAKKQDLAAGNRKKTIKPANGTGRYRILPSWRGAGQQFWHDFGQHFVKDATKKISAIYMCTDKTFGKPCAVCDAISQGMKSATDDFTMELLREARSSGRVLVNALHLDGPTPGEVQILELPPTAFGMVIAIAQEWEEAGESIIDPAKGKDILISREGAGLKTKYTVQVAAKTMPMPADTLGKLHDLDEYVNQESSEQQLRALNSVRSVSGLLLAAPAGAASIDEDPYAVAAPPPPPKRAAAPAVEAFEDVEVKAAPVAAKVAPKVAPVTPAASESTGDDELDALLSTLS